MADRSTAWALALGMMLAGAAWSGCGDGSSGGATSAAALLDSIPEHGEDPGPQADVTYVGRVDGTDALIAVVADDGAAVAYVCDGRQVSEWFLGSSSEGVLDLDGDKGGSVLGQVGASAVGGDVTHAGVQHAFAASRAVERQSGIYRSVEGEGGERVVSGWIFYDGELRGADEDSGKSVVGSVSVGGIGTGTGSGTGLPAPAPTATPVPQFVCGELWCSYENTKCLISALVEERQNAKSKKRAQIDAMIKSAQKRLNDLGNDITELGCVGNSSCSDTGFDNAQDTANCG